MEYTTISTRSHSTNHLQQKSFINYQLEHQFNLFYNHLNKLNPRYFDKHQLKNQIIDQFDLHQMFNHQKQQLLAFSNKTKTKNKNKRKITKKQKQILIQKNTQNYYDCAQNQVLINQSKQFSNPAQLFPDTNQSQNIDHDQFQDNSQELEDDIQQFQYKYEQFQHKYQQLQEQMIVDENQIGYIEDLNNFQRNPHQMMAKQQQSYSKQIQMQYLNGNTDQKIQIFRYCIAHIHCIINDRYRNYILQVVLEQPVNQDCIKQIYEYSLDRIQTIAVQKYSSKVLCKLIEVIDQYGITKQEYQQSIFKKLVQIGILELAVDEFGTFVVQKMVQTYRDQKLQYMIDLFQQQAYKLCVNKYGCLVIQKLLDLEIENQQIDQLIDQIIAHGLELSLNKFSNYIIQHIQKRNQEPFLTQIQEQIILPNFIQLSCNQYGSNVVETMVLNVDSDFNKQLWTFLQQNPSKILEVVNDQFGNYVIQKYYQNCDHEIQSQLSYLLNQNINKLSKEGKFVWKNLSKINHKTCNYYSNLM